MTNSSGEACGPSAPRSMPGASVMSRGFFAREAAGHLGVAARAQDDHRAADRRCRCIAARKPSAIDSTATNTMTTPAMPMIATTEEPSRCRIDRRLTRGDGDDLRQPVHGTSPLRCAQRVDDLAAGCACTAGSSPVPRPSSDDEDDAERPGRAAGNRRPAAGRRSDRPAR